VATVARIAKLLRQKYGKPPRRLGGPLDVLIETILSQNTTDKNSSRAYARLKAKFPSWGKVASASVKSIEQAIRVGGLPNIKAKRIKDVLNEIGRREGKLSLGSLKKKNTDDAFAYLTSFDGVGPKTAAIVLSFAFGRDTVPADTHVHRVSNRLGIVHTKSPAKTQAELEKIVRDGDKHSFHINLIEHGRQVCKAQKPQCSLCFLSPVCQKNGIPGKMDKLL